MRLTLGMEAAREYCVVMPLERLPVAVWIDRRRWPPHVTVCSNFRSGPHELDALADVLRREAARTAPPSARVGGDALFGPDGDVPVRLVESDAVHGIHRSLWESIRSVTRVDAVTPAHLGRGYRPHVTRVGAGDPEPGDALRLHSLVLVEVAPDGDASWAVPVAAAEIGATAPGEPVSAIHAAEVWTTFAGAGVRSWVIGGWGIDALLGRVTREHHDLDLFVHADDLRALLDHLETTGSPLQHLWSENRWHDRMPTAFVARVGEVEVDVHVVVLDDRTPRPLSEHTIELPPGALDAVGSIAGRRVACATSEAQALMHSGYELPDRHRRDLDLLARRRSVT